MISLYSVITFTAVWECIMRQQYVILYGADKFWGDKQNLLILKKGRAIPAPAFLLVFFLVYLVVAKVKLPTRKLLLVRQI